MIESYIEEIRPFPDSRPRSELLPGVIWTFVNDGLVEAVTFRCPCGCGNENYTPVTDATKGQKKEEHSWLFSRGPNGVTIAPSIRWLAGCKAHFNITDGKTIMHADSGK